MSRPQLTMGTHIELVGLPGAGKSTLLARLSAIPASSNLRMPRLLPPVVPFRRDLIRRTAGITLRALYNDPALWRFSVSQGGRWVFGKLGYRLAGLDRRGRAADGALLVDGGVLQPLVSFPAEFRVHGSAAAPTKSLLKLLPLPLGMIYVSTSAETAFSRYVKRQTETGRRCGVAVACSDFHEAEKVCELIAEMCANAGTRLFIVDERMLQDAACETVLARELAMLADRSDLT